MAAPTPDPVYPDFSALYTHILTLLPPLTPPTKPTSPALTAKISALSLHPTLETALHILNNDLPSAHFLVRHMQSPPAYEGMFLHGILHRIEGDYDNARAWYSNVKDSEVFHHAWHGGEEQARGFIDRIEGFVKSKESDEVTLKESLREIKAVVDFCREKFGDGEMRDASEAFVRNDEKHQKMSEDMVSGGKGFRKF
ncbi:MAG: hypothetical protein Q9217_006542 [Psora testacea]